MQTGNPHKDTPWWRWLVLIWLVMSAVLIAYRWPNIQFLILADTDDNLRLAQVKAWLGGQDWYDLRQYRLNPPEGANIHWSRLPDLPIAGLMLVFQPFFGWLGAEKIAVAVAPLLPFGIALFGVGLMARRLVAPGAWLWGAAMLFAAPSALGMFAPTRIDHHGWQLAFLALALAGLVDPRRARGGATLGVATAASLSVGLEMLPYLGLAGAMLGLRWLIEGKNEAGLRAYGVALSAGTALGFQLFASLANQAPRCDALTPVWMSTVLLAGALLVLLSFLSRQNVLTRTVGAGLAAGVLGFFFVTFWPNCLSRPEGISDELYRQWFVNISEVRPLYKDSLKSALPIVALPVAGLIGSVVMMWQAQGRRLSWLAPLVLNLVALLMLFWQTRAAPAAQVLAIPGAAALAWLIIPRLATSPARLVRILGVPFAFTLVSGLAVNLLTLAIPSDAGTARAKVKAGARQASAKCTTLSALRPIAKLPVGTIFTFVDLGPRLIAMTPHSAIAGPYHRNGEAILDVFRAFRGTPEAAHGLITGHQARYVLICPGMAEARNHLGIAPKGFLAKLQNGQTPDWLAPVPLPLNSPYMMWRVLPPEAAVKN
jgi:hypothetical protein